MSIIERGNRSVILYFVDFDLAWCKLGCNLLELKHLISKDDNSVVRCPHTRESMVSSRLLVSSDATSNKISSKHRF